MFTKIALGITFLSCSTLSHYALYATASDPLAATPCQSHGIQSDLDHLVEVCSGQANVESRSFL
jgi:hypothetical protein